MGKAGESIGTTTEGDDWELEKHRDKDMDKTWILLSN